MSRTFLVFALLAVLAGAQTSRNGIKKGEWKPQHVPEGYAVYNIGRYQFQSDAPADRVKRIGAHLNEMFRIYMKKFPSRRTPKQRFVVKVFKDRKGFREYGAPAGAGAYYSWHDKEMVGYDTGLLDGELDPLRFGGTTGEQERPGLDAMRKKFTMDTIGAFAHEGWHQYFHFYCASKIEFPSWCDEGIGEYFYPSTRKGSKMQLGLPNTYRLEGIQNAIRANKHVPLQEIVGYNQQKYYRIAGLAYAQGWSMVHFFMEHPKYKKKRYVERFVTVFADKHSIEKTVPIVFGKVKWEEVEADWKEWVLAIEDPNMKALLEAEAKQKAADAADAAGTGDARERGLGALGESLGGEKPASDRGAPAKGGDKSPEK